MTAVACKLARLATYAHTNVQALLGRQAFERLSLCCQRSGEFGACLDANTTRGEPDAALFSLTPGGSLTLHQRLPIGEIARRISLSE
jgi:hypothetical protein